MVKGASYRQLLQGHLNFRNQASNELLERYKSLANQQNPKVTIITCSDSRIDPCELTQAGAGDLFVIRNAGNIVPLNTAQLYSETASLEFAVKGLKTEHIIICGHSNCGAMSCVLNPENCGDMNFVSDWISKARKCLDNIDTSKELTLKDVVEANVAYQLSKLDKLPFVEEALNNGDLKTHGWVFDIQTAKISVLNKETGKFEDPAAA